MSRYLFVAIAIVLSLFAGDLAHAGEQTKVATQTKTSEDSGRVNVNTASLGQLMLLPGVGPTTAQAIIAQRERRKFARKEQLLRVRGIGPKTLKKLRPFIKVKGPTTLSSKVSGKH